MPRYFARVPRKHRCLRIFRFIRVQRYDNLQVSSQAARHQQGEAAAERSGSRVGQGLTSKVVQAHVVSSTPNGVEVLAVGAGTAARRCQHPSRKVWPG